MGYLINSCVSGIGQQLFGFTPLYLEVEGKEGGEKREIKGLLLLNIPETGASILYMQF